VKKLLLAALCFGLLTACADVEEQTPTSTSENGLSADTLPAGGPKTADTLPAGDDGAPGTADILPADDGSDPLTPPPAPAPGPALPSPVPGADACTPHASEAACLAHDGCAWGDQGAGHVCFFVGEIIPFGG